MMKAETAKRRGLRRTHGAWPAAFLFNLTVLQIFGLVMLFSASYAYAYRTSGSSYVYILGQLRATLVGEIALLLAARYDYHWLRRWTGWGYAGCIALLLVVLTCAPINNCRRWLHWDSGPLKVIPSIQVSELVKFEMILLTAAIMCYYRDKKNTFRYGILYPLLPLVPIAGLMVAEPHVSGMILICVIVGTMMLLGCSGGKWMPCLLALGGVGILLLYKVIGPHIDYVEKRLERWTQDFDKMTYQTQQSLLAIGSGGLLGTGLGNSMEKQLWLPYCMNDFIFSIVCEELGFIGAMMVVLLFALLIAQGVYIAFHAPDLYGTLLALGITAQVAWQVFCNIAVVTNALPNTGISLPFFSDGGSSLMMLLGEMGVLVSIARCGAEKAAAAEKSGTDVPVQSGAARPNAAV